MLRHAFLKGFVIGLLVTFPLFILAEHIRYGFVSTWCPMWLIFLVPLFASAFVKEGERLPLLWRMLLFVEYASIFSLVTLRTIRTEGLLLAVLLVSVVYVAYLTFKVR